MSVWGHCNDRFVRMKSNQREGISLALMLDFSMYSILDFFFLKTDIDFLTLYSCFQIKLHCK